MKRFTMMLVLTMIVSMLGAVSAFAAAEKRVDVKEGNGIYFTLTNIVEEKVADGEPYFISNGPVVVKFEGGNFGRQQIALYADSKVVGGKFVAGGQYEDIAIDGTSKELTKLGLYSISGAADEYGKGTFALLRITDGSVEAETETNSPETVVAVDQSSEGLGKVKDVVAGEKRIATKQGGYVTISNVNKEISFINEGAGVGDIIYISDKPVTISINGNESHPNISFRPLGQLNGEYFDIGSEREEVEVKGNMAFLSKPGYYAVNVRFTGESSPDTVAEFVVQIDGSASVSKPEVKPELVRASPTASKVLVNGKEVSFEAYNINENNFFKLRDLAAAINGTDKQFEVSWDGVKNAISLESNKAYIVAGGELKVSDQPAFKEAKSTDSKIYVDGKEIPFTAYTIDDNNYFKLRDIAKVFNIGITWDSTTNTVGIDTKIDYKE